MTEKSMRKKLSYPLILVLCLGMMCHSVAVCAMFFKPGASHSESINKSFADTIARKGRYGSAGFMPYMSLNQFYAGAADTAKVIFIDDDDKWGIFRYDPKDSKTAQDGAIVLVYKQKRYKRLFDHLTPEMFGAKRDGVTDDAAAIQRTLDYASRVNGAKIVFSPGTYLVGSTLKLKPVNGAPDFNYKVMLQGAGLGTTDIIGTKGIKGNLLEMTYGQTKYQGKDNRVIIRDISFTAGSADRCFYADFVAQLRLEDCRFNGGQEVTVQIGSDEPTQNYSTYITRCYFGGYTTTGGLNKSTLVLKQNIFTAIEEMETDGGRIGIDISNSAACIVNNSKIEGCKYAGIRIRGEGNGEHRITNNYIICYGGLDFNAQFDGEMYGILVQGNTSGSSAANTIANNIIRLESTKTLNVVARMSQNKALQYNSVKNIITGQRSGAKGYVWGINNETKSIVIKPISGNFVKGEAVSQAGTGGSAVLSTVVNPVTYGIKLEGNNGANNISGNQLTTMSTYGIYIKSDANMIVGNTINGATGVYSNANGTSLVANIFWCTDAPAVAIERAGGSNFTSLNNIIQSGTLLGMETENIIEKRLQTGLLILKDLPISDVGLTTGALWMDKEHGNVLKIVP